MTLKRKPLDEVHPGHNIPRHSLFAHSAHGHYQATLLLFEESEKGLREKTFRGVHAWPSIILLMEQSIEMFLKAFLLLNNPSIDVIKFSHRLDELLDAGEQLFTEFCQLKSSQECHDLIRSLKESYKSIRYGEDWYSISRSKIIDTYNKIISTLADGYSARTKIRLQ